MSTVTLIRTLPIGWLTCTLLTVIARWRTGIDMTYMIYGATGYTGRLAIRFAVAAGERPLLAGRNPEKVAAVAREFDLDWTAFSLDDRPAATAALADVGAVFNAPSAATTARMA